MSKWRLHCLVPRIKGKAVLLHELQQGISNRSALREEIIKRDVRVLEGERNTDWLKITETSYCIKPDAPDIKVLWRYTIVIWENCMNVYEFYVLPTQCIYVFCVDLRTNSDISIYRINWLVCITETECVYCAVRTGSLYIILRSAHTVYLCVLCGSENKERLLPYTALTDLFL